MELFPVPNMPEVRPGDDVATLIRERVRLEPDDIVIVASTIVSKAEDRRASLGEYDSGPRAEAIASRLQRITGDDKDPRFAQAVIEESTELLLEAPFLLTRTPCGHIGVNAGIDRSNTGGADLLLLPERPSESAKRIHEDLPGEHPVIVSDTCGRPFRHGQVGVAIGWAGMQASRDWRGTDDRDGHELTVTVEAVIDELAAAANLVSGEGAAGQPVVIVRGYEGMDEPGSNAFYRDEETDFVRAALRDWEYDPD